MGILIADPRPRLRGALGPLQGLALGERVCQGCEIPYLRYWMETLWKNYNGLVGKNVSRIYHVAYCLG